MSFNPYEGIAPPESDPAIALELREAEDDSCEVEQEMKLSTLYQIITRELVEHGDETLRVRVSSTAFECRTLYRRK